MSEFEPISTRADLNLQNEDEMVAGYIAGLNGDPVPSSAYSRSYWHGWRNGMADKGKIPHDKAMMDLAHEIFEVLEGNLIPKH